MQTFDDYLLENEDGWKVIVFSFSFIFPSIRTSKLKQTPQTPVRGFVPVPDKEG